MFKIYTCSATPTIYNKLNKGKWKCQANQSGWDNPGNNAKLWGEFAFLCVESERYRLRPTGRTAFGTCREAFSLRTLRMPAILIIQIFFNILQTSLDFEDMLENNEPFFMPPSSNLQPRHFEFLSAAGVLPITFIYSCISLVGAPLGYKCCINFSQEQMLQRFHIFMWTFSTVIW